MRYLPYTLFFMTGISLGVSQVSSPAKIKFSKPVVVESEIISDSQLAPPISEIALISAESSETLSVSPTPSPTPISTPAPTVVLDKIAPPSVVAANKPSLELKDMGIFLEVSLENPENVSDTLVSDKPERFLNSSERLDVNWVSSVQVGFENFDSKQFSIKKPEPAPTSKSVTDLNPTEGGVVEKEKPGIEHPVITSGPPVDSLLVSSDGFPIEASTPVSSSALGTDVNLIANVPKVVISEVVGSADSYGLPPLEGNASPEIRRAELVPIPSSEDLIAQTGYQEVPVKENSALPSELAGSLLEAARLSGGNSSPLSSASMGTASFYPPVVGSTW